jgi:uncharacterized protein YbjT (DUF2867 family)
MKPPLARAVSTDTTNVEVKREWQPTSAMTTDSNSNEPRTILITGANGHLGRRLVAHLAGKHRVVAVVRSERAGQQLAGAGSAVEVIVLDYGDRRALTAAATGCTHAVHLVGIIKESASTSFLQAHEEVTQSLIAAADSNRLKRIVYLSILGSQPASSNGCLASKGRAERMLLQAKTSALILKVPMVLGEGDFAAAALSRRARARVNLLIRGSSLEQPIYAGDVVKAMTQGITRSGLDDVVLDLAGPESLSRRELIARAAKMLGKQPRSLSLPLGVGMAFAFMMENAMGNPPLSRAMLGVLDHDDHLDGTEACDRLGIELTPLDEMLRSCLRSD